MIKQTFTGTIETAYGEKLPKALPFSGDYDAFENYAEAETAKALLSNEEELKVINNDLKAAARAKAIEATLKAAGYNKPDPNSPEELRKTFVSTLMKSKKMSAEDAGKVADSLGM